MKVWMKKRYFGWACLLVIVILCAGCDEGDTGTTKAEEKIQRICPFIKVALSDVKYSPPDWPEVTFKLSSTSEDEVGIYRGCAVVSDVSGSELGRIWIDRSIFKPIPPNGSIISSRNLSEEYGDFVKKLKEQSGELTWKLDLVRYGQKTNGEFISKDFAPLRFVASYEGNVSGSPNVKFWCRIENTSGRHFKRIKGKISIYRKVNPEDSGGGIFLRDVPFEIHGGLEYGKSTTVKLTFYKMANESTVEILRDMPEYVHLDVFPTLLEYTDGKVEFYY